jgi:beta-barrel assembly-enhancing protease
MDQSQSTRRAFLAGVGCCAAGTMLPLHSALAALDPMKLQPAFKPGYKPLENDERGLWQQMEKLESDMRASNLVMRDSALNSYINDLGCKISADYCRDTRIYVLRTPYFNASMAPNGMMLIWSGLLLRYRNEAQLASVMGHEIGHYTRQHSLQRHRDVRDKASLMTFLAAPLAIVGGAGASQLGQLIVLSSIFANSREQEREADSIGLLALEKHGYPPEEASRVWQQLINERDASFKARKRKAPSEDLIFATHPQSADRMEALDRFAF